MVLMGKSSIKFYKWGNHPNQIIQMAAQLFPTAWHQKTLPLCSTISEQVSSFKSRLDAPLTSDSLTNYLGMARIGQEHPSKRRSKPQKVSSEEL